MLGLVRPHAAAKRPVPEEKVAELAVLQQALDEQKKKADRRVEQPRDDTVRRNPGLVSRNKNQTGGDHHDDDGNEQKPALHH